MIDACASAESAATEAPSALLTRDRLDALSNDQLDDALTELCSHMNAAEHRLLCLVREWDQRGLSGDYGARSTANWLNFKCGIALGAAREKVRVARALEQLPLIDETLRRGEISYSKVRAMTRVATPDNEALLLQYALHATASQLEQIVAGFRRLERLEDPERLLNLRRSRGLYWHWDEDGMLVIHGRLAPEDGALLLKAVNAMKDRMYREESDPSEPDPVEEGPIEGSVAGPGTGPRAVDALLRLLETGMQAEPRPLSGGERTQVVLHVPVGDPQAQQEARPVLDEGPVVAPETARRLACDAGWVVHREGASGETLSIGRRSRTVPTGMRRALQRRDRGCRFPGCCERRWVDAHHIHHWAEGGETSMENLVLLCRHHHRLVHEEGFGCERDGDGRIRFRMPDGGLLPEAFRLKRGAYMDLVDLKMKAGLNISAETCNGGWDGQPWDKSETVEHVWAATTGSIYLPSCCRKEDWTWSRERGWRHVSAETSDRVASDRVASTNPVSVYARSSE